MPDPIIPYQPFGTIPSWPPSPAKLDRDLDAQNHKIINVDWTGDPINLSTDVTGRLPYANIQQVTAQRLLGRDTPTGDVQEIIIGSNLTLTGGTLSAATSGGAGSGDFSTNTSVSVVDEIVLFSNTGGKQGKRSTGSGRPKLTSGVLSLAAIDLTAEVTGVLPAANVAVLPTANIADLAVTNAKLAGGITASKLVGTDIATVGTITSGTWAGSTVGLSYGGTGSTSALGARGATGLNIESRADVGDVAYNISDKDKVIATSAGLTAPRTWTLPLASAVNNGTRIIVLDAVGGVNATNYITVIPTAPDTLNGSSAGFIVSRAYDAVTFVSVSSGWVVAAGNRPRIVKTFASNQTYTTPVGVKSILVECVGGGGAGGGAAVSVGTLSLGSGGGGAGYGARFIASPAASYLITIGTGGAGVAGGTGNNGSDTTFGAVCTGGGGSGGTVLTTGSSLNFVSGASSPGGNYTGDFGVKGDDGGAGTRLSATVGLAGSGGAAGYGMSGRRAGSANTTSDGNAGYANGGGGSGAITTSTAQAGGVGANGICLVTEYY